MHAPTHLFVGLTLSRTGESTWPVDGTFLSDKMIWFCLLLDAARFCADVIEKEKGITMVQPATANVKGSHPFVESVHGVRYQVKDVARSVAFYTQHLGFKLRHQ